MKICIDGSYRDATPEEISAWEEESQNMPKPELTVEDRISALLERISVLEQNALDS